MARTYAVRVGGSQGPVAHTRGLYSSAAVTDGGVVGSSSATVADGLGLRGAVSLSTVTPVNDFDWSDANLPWAYTSTDEFTANWPAGVVETDLVTGTNDFDHDLEATLAPYPSGSRLVVRVPDGVHSIREFRLIGSSGDPKYAFGFWNPKLRGLLGNGPDKCFIQVEPNITTQAQRDSIRQMQTGALSSPLQMGFCRIDSDSSSRTLIAGITFRGADQQDITSVTTQALEDALLYGSPFDCPYQGPFFYSNTLPDVLVSHCRFQAAGRLHTTLPPYECSNFNFLRGTVIAERCEFDSRRAAVFDVNRTPACGAIMANQATLSRFDRCWMHHTNGSRYAMNASSGKSDGTYEFVRSKIEQISLHKTTSPAPSMGWESANGNVTLTDSIVSADVDYATSWPQFHMAFTEVGTSPTSAGAITVTGTTFRETAHAQMDGFLVARILNNTAWYEEGLANTTFVYHPTSGQRLSPYIYTGGWPISQGTIDSAGISPSTHYIVKAT